MFMRTNTVSCPEDLVQREILWAVQSNKIRPGFTKKKVKRDLRVKFLIVTELVGGVIMIVMGILKNIQ